MRCLVLGGTKFLGRYVVESILEHGHEPTLFNRGQTNPELFPDVEKLIGDRDGGLDALAGRTFDAVVDTSGYLPRVVRATAELLNDGTSRYNFVSSISAYASLDEPGADEATPLAELEDDAGEDIATHYGPLKARCEREVEAVYGDRALILRPGLIVGPHDPTNRFAYWVTRVASGGKVLAPDVRNSPIQVIDVRDLAKWIVQSMEKGESGTYNTVGPETPITFGELLEACVRVAGSDAEIVWVPEEFLDEHGVEPWSDLPLWAHSKEGGGFFEVDGTKAFRTGLRTRPIEDTVSDTLEWAHSAPEAPGPLAPDREADLLATWSGR